MLGGGGFAEPATAAQPSPPSLFFQANRDVPNPGRTGTTGNNAFGQPFEGNAARPPAPLMFSSPSGAVADNGEAIVNTASAPRGHWTELLNFHGSPAPWILIGLLLAAGLLHLSASGRAGFKGTL
jgi:hypothetical protein